MGGGVQGPIEQVVRPKDRKTKREIDGQTDRQRNEEIKIQA